MTSILAKLMCATGYMLSVAIVLLSGCTPSIMTIEVHDAPRISPLGLFVIGSSQIVDNDDSVHKAFVLQTANTTLPKLFQEGGYEMRPLNSVLKAEEVFSKYFSSFYINEHKIAEVAKDNGYSSVLIVYFAYALKESTLITGLNIYGLCSLYGWLVNTKDATVISSSHSRLSSYAKYLETTSPEIKSLPREEIYRSFFKHIMFEMFGNISKSHSSQSLRAFFPSSNSSNVLGQSSFNSRDKLRSASSFPPV